MNATDIVAELKKLGTAQTKKTWMNHGAQEPCFGVKVEDMKKIQKRVKVNYQLALDLYDTGIADAMYLAGLIADDAKMSKNGSQTPTGAWSPNLRSHGLRRRARTVERWP
jgi:3-methyladenine DNA glycosylase AlkD